MRQEVPIVGTPYRLAYSSQRAPGWGADQTASMEVRGATVPASLAVIDAQIRGNGITKFARYLPEEFADKPFLEYQFRFPDHDAFGRPVQGRRRGGPIENGTSTEGDFLLGNHFLRVTDLAAGADGKTYLADAWSNQVVAGELAFPDFIEGEELRIADGGVVYEFDRRGRHLRTRHSLTGATLYEFGYDRQGLLSTITDGDGNVTTIERDGSGQATAIVSPFGQRTVLTIDPGGWLESIENPNHEKWTFGYRLGQMVEKEDPRGNGKIYEYSELGRLIGVVDEEQKRRGFSLWRRYGMLDQTVTQVGSHSQKFRYTVRGDKDGSIYRAQVDPDQVFSSSRTYRDGKMERSSRGVLIDTRSRPDPRLGEGGAYTAATTVWMGELRLESGFSIDAPLADPTDPWSFEEIAEVGAVNGRVTSRLFEAASRRMTTVSPEGRTVTLQLDHLARPIHFEAPEIEPWTATYADSGEIEELMIGSGLEARTTTFGYDAFHRVESIEDAEERTVSFAYDGANRVTSTILPDGKAVGFAYDPNGNVTQVTPPGRPAHVFTYTPRNQLETYILPDVGTGVAVEQRVYDKSQRLEEVRRPDGKTIRFEYQPYGNHLKRIVSPHGNTDFEFDETTGMVSEITEPDGQELAFEYEGTLLKKTTWTGEVNGSVSRTYDENFRVKTLSVNGQDPVEYTYDDDGLLIQVGEMTISRDPETGREVDTQLGNVKTHRTYTSFGEPETYTAKFGETEIYFESYVYNKLGWITDLERRQNGFHELLHYVYDQRGRLEEVWRDGALESKYTYDDNSNRLSYTGPLGNATGTYDNRDRMLTYGGASYTWSEAGELTSKTEGGGTTTYDYDVFGNLRKVVLPNGIEIEYLTDGAQRRIGKKVNGVLVKQWLYQDRLEPVAELDEGGVLDVALIYGARPHVPDYLESQGSHLRVISDHLGSTRMLIDVSTGAIILEQRFEEFGRIVFSTQAEFSRWGFSGGLNDEHSDLVRFGRRDYFPAAGRWTAPDPILLLGREYNFYQYASGQPMNKIDPPGLADWFFGFEFDSVRVIGQEAGLGVVVDTDSPRQSGLFYTGGIAVGWNNGAAVGGGCYFRDSEGWGYSADTNLPAGLSGQLFFDSEGWNGWGLSAGPGSGFSASMTYTSTLGAQNVDDTVGEYMRKTLGNYLDQLNQAIEQELTRLSH